MPVLFLRRKSIYSLPVILCLILSFFVFSSNVFGNTDFDNALALYRELEQEPFSEAKIAQYDGVIALLDKALAAEEFSSEVACQAELLKSKCLEAQAKYPEALQSYGAYLDRLKGEVDEDYAYSAGRSRAEAQFELRDYAGAIQSAQLLLDKYPENPMRYHVHLLMGLACIEEGFPEAAEGHFQKIISEDPDGPCTAEAYRKLAYSLYLGGDYQGSLATLDALAAKFPSEMYGGYVQYRKGFTLVVMGDLTGALVEWQKGISQYPANPYSRESARLVEIFTPRVEEQLLGEDILNVP
jgi:tetratricopeptide (TPR) repeat protein